MNVKLAAYTDEVFDDPDKAGELLISKSITNVCLRRAWCRDISSMPDNAISILDNILIKHKLSPILLHTDIGCVDPEKLLAEEQKFVRALQICKFLKCRSLRIGIGTSSKPAVDISSTPQITPKFSPSPNGEIVQKWISIISGLSISYDIALVLEPENNSYYNQAASIAMLLQKSRRLNLLFDPALLVIRSRINPFVKFWSLLKSRVSFIDIHDFKTGDSAKPAGLGDAQLDILVADAIASKFNGWFCLEPGLGNRYGNATTREKTFLRAFDAFESLLQRIQLPKIL
jgi:sugar phosphate isomerase/epimerase